MRKPVSLISTNLMVFNRGPHPVKGDCCICAERTELVLAWRHTVHGVAWEVLYICARHFATWLQLVPGQGVIKERNVSLSRGGYGLPKACECCKQVTDRVVAFYDDDNAMKGWQIWRACDTCWAEILKLTPERGMIVDPKDVVIS